MGRRPVKKAAVLLWKPERKPKAADLARWWCGWPSSFSVMVGQPRVGESGFHSVGSRSALKPCKTGGFEAKLASVEGFRGGTMVRGAIEESSPSETKGLSRLMGSR